jgi:hypothetical protein
MKKGGGGFDAGKEKGRTQESRKKEDRKKEEISFPLYVHAHFWLGKIFSSLFFGLLLLRSCYYETPFLTKFQDIFLTPCKIRINLQIMSSKKNTGDRVSTGCYVLCSVRQIAVPVKYIEKPNERDKWSKNVEDCLNCKLSGHIIFLTGYFSQPSGRGDNCLSQSRLSVPLRPLQ